MISRHRSGSVGLGLGVVLALATAAGSGAAQPKPKAAPAPAKKEANMDPLTLEFESLKFATGAEYVKHRRGLVVGAALGQTPGGRAALRSYLVKRSAESDWRTATTAAILLGWVDHANLYEALEQAIVRSGYRNAPDLATPIRLRATSPEDRRSLVAFAWEGILKHHDDWEREKRAPLFKILEEQPVDGSIEVLFFYIEELAEGCSDRSAAIRPLKRLPADRVKLRAGATARVRVAADDALNFLDFPPPAAGQ